HGEYLPGLLARRRSGWAGVFDRHRHGAVAAALTCIAWALAAGGIDHLRALAAAADRCQWLRSRRGTDCPRLSDFRNLEPGGLSRRTRSERAWAGRRYSRANAPGTVGFSCGAGDPVLLCHPRNLVEAHLPGGLQRCSAGG